MNGMFISLLNGEAKRVVTSVGQSGIFCAIALKTFKCSFGDPIVVSYMSEWNILCDCT